MRTLVVVVVLLLGCKDSDKEKARDVASGAKDNLGKVVDKAGDVANQAVDKAGDVANKAVDTAGAAYDKALVLGKGAKAELDKVYKTDKEYALAIDEPSSDEVAAHTARLDKMPSVEIKGVRVGYEEDSNLSLRGTTYAKHFRASYKRSDGKIVRVSFYTKETLDVLAFAQLLAKIVPAVETVIQ